MILEKNVTKDVHSEWYMDCMCSTEVKLSPKTQALFVNVYESKLSVKA